MDLQSKLAEHERKKKRITWVGLGIIALLIAAVIVAADAKGEPDWELYMAQSELDTYCSQLSDAEDALAEKKSRLAELEESIAETKALLDERKAELENGDGEDETA